MFLFGTVVGSYFFDFNTIDDQNERKDRIKRVFIKTIVLFGVASLTFGILYRFYDFLYRTTISAFFYSIGTILIIFAILLYREEFEILKTKKSFRFFFYFSYYSFTIYIAHDALYPLFYRQLNVIIIWFVFIGVITLIALLLRFLHKRVGSKASLKAQLGVLSLIILSKIEQLNKKRQKN
jgi:hypothetical protein